MPILSRASDLLRESTGRAALNGYQDKSRKRAWAQVAAIYRAVAELGIRYINPPASFENSGQKVSFPSRIVAERFGTCLDLTLLFAACCERAGLHPLVLMHEGHAYAGCWLEERTFPDSAAEGADALQQCRKLETEQMITVFETTVVASEAPGQLGDAERPAREHLQTEKPFRLALDVNRARIGRIVPMPIPGMVHDSMAPSSSKASVVVEGIGDRDFAEPINPTTVAAAKPATRIDQWKSRLLDLSLRNRLLNFKETKSTIRLLSAAPEHVEDELAAETELALRPKPKLMSEDDPRHGATMSKQQRADALVAHLGDELEHGRLHTNLDDSEHARRLTELFRAARNALEENGTNTLFAAVGFLEWRETEHSDRVYRAPLLLVPVELKRKSVLEGFSLRRIDEETRLNVTLMEMLRQNFHKEIPGLEPLPEDESGADVPRVFQLFRDAVRDLPGWEVKTEIWLGQFSFTKFLLWKDLADRLDDLTRNRIVNHLVNAAGTPYANPSDDIKPPQLDDQFHPRDVFCPRSADSSQLAAVMAASAGHDFVLEGPPGTGKSQTITNIIAHCLAHGKRVLFVAEKRAALDVVHRRLREEGLEPFCLELHSNKTGKADVLAQFDRSLKFATEEGAVDWEHRAAELERLRAALNGYTRALHRRTPCGLSAHSCFDYLLPRQTEATVKLDSWPTLLETPAAKLEDTRQLTRHLQERSRAVMPLHGHALAPLACEDWSPAWAERALEQIRALAGYDERKLLALELDTLKQKWDSGRDAWFLMKWLRVGYVRRHLRTARADQAKPEISTLEQVLVAAIRLRAVSAELAGARVDAEERLGPTIWSEGEPDVVRLTAVRAWGAIFHERLTALASEDTDWLAVLRRLIGGLLPEGPSSYGPDTRVGRRLRRFHDDLISFDETYESLSGAAAFDRAQLDDSPDHLAAVGAALDVFVATAPRIRSINADLTAAAATAQACLSVLWSKGEPSAESLSRAREWGNRLHARMIDCSGGDMMWLGQLRQILATLFNEGPASFAPGTEIGRRLTRFNEGLAAFEKAFDRVATEVKLRRADADAASDHLSAVRAICERAPTAWSQIREWCS